MRWSESRGRGIAHLVLVRRMTRYIVLIFGLALFASCASSPVTTREAEPARSRAEPGEPGYHQDPSGFSNRDLASLLNGLVGH
jgi:hypothetical protein